MKPATPCAFCGKPSTLLCDFVLGWPVDSQSSLHVVPFRCDAPMCAACAHQASSLHICSRGKGGGCTHDTIDYCPYHVAINNTREVVGAGENKTIITAAEAQQRRRELYGDRGPATDLTVGHGGTDAGPQLSLFEKD